MSASLRLLNIIYTNNMPESVAFYEKLGLFRKVDGAVDQWWNEFPVGNASLALHWNEGKELPSESNPELHFQMSPSEFEAVYAEIGDLVPSPVETMEGIGRYFTVTDPNGVRVQINEESQ